MTTPVTLLDWDSEFFGIRIARLQDGEHNSASLRLANEYCEKNGVRCVYALIDAESTDAAHFLEADGYRFVDIRITLLQKISGAYPVETYNDVQYRQAEERDIPKLKAIASISHVDSRYYADPGFERQRCNELYEAWIENSCHGFADAVLVAEKDGDAAGYITCKVCEDGRGEIGLFAVGESAQGLGIGKNLVKYSLDWFSGQGCDRVSVVTQGCNCRAQQVYQKNGFVTSASQLWFHKWYEA